MTTACNMNVHFCCISFSLWGTSSPGPPTGALPLDPTGGLVSPDPLTSRPLTWNPEYVPDIDQTCFLLRYDFNANIVILNSFRWCHSDVTVIKLIIGMDWHIKTKIGYTHPLDWVWYAEVIATDVLSCLHRSFTMLLNSRPWSWRKTWHDLNRQTSDVRKRCIPSADLSGTACVSGHLVRYSVATIIYLLPCDVSFSGPTMSMPHLWKSFGLK